MTLIRSAVLLGGIIGLAGLSASDVIAAGPRAGGAPPIFIDQSAEVQQAERPIAAAGVLATAPARAGGVFTWAFVREAVMVGLTAVILGVFIARGWHRLRGPLSQNPTRAFAPLIFFAGTILAIQVGVRAASFFDRSATDAQAQTEATGDTNRTSESEPREAQAAEPTPTEQMASEARFRLAGSLAALPVIIGGLWFRARARRRDGETGVGLIGAFLAGLGVLVLIWPMLETAGNTAAHVQDVMTDLPPKLVAHETLDLLIHSNSAFWQWVTIGIAVVGAPLLEETMYRGMLQEGLKHLFAARWPAIFVTSVIFTAMHIGPAEPHALAALFVLSLGFGWLYEKTGSIIAPMVMHGAFNVANILLALLLVNPNATL